MAPARALRALRLLPSVLLLLAEAAPAAAAAATGTAGSSSAFMPIPAAAPGGPHLPRAPAAPPAAADASVWAHDWASGASLLWADYSSPTAPLNASIAAFLASTYRIISLEKCLGRAQDMLTEDAYVLTAAQLKVLNPAVKMLFYWNAMVDISGPAFPPCYAAGAHFLEHPELWLRGDDGAPLLNGPFYLHNLTTADAMRFMMGTPAGVQARNASLFDGIFADSTLASPYANMSQARNDALNAAINAVSLAQSLVLNAAAPTAGVQVIGNGLAQYHVANPGFPADDGAGMVPFMDGVCVEHWAAFEMTDANNCSVVPALVEDMLARIAAVAALNKTVLIKGWPGPVTAPITDLGPTWPAACGDPGSSREARGASAARWFTPSFALYLLAADATVYWSYNWLVCSVVAALPSPMRPSPPLRLRPSPGTRS